MLDGEILIVDDSSTSRMIIQRCIEMAGIDTGGFRHAGNGLEALAALRAQVPGGPRIAVVVTDINMPKMDGATFLKLLRADPALAGLPAIVVSSVATGEEGSDGEFLALGARAVVKKPVSPAKMLSVLGGL